LEKTKLFTHLSLPKPYAVPYLTHFIAVSGNTVAEWEKDMNSKSKNLIRILWQSKGNLPLISYCTNLFEKRLSLSPHWIQSRNRNQFISPTM